MAGELVARRGIISKSLDGFSTSDLISVIDTNGKILQSTTTIGEVESIISDSGNFLTINNFSSSNTNILSLNKTGNNIQLTPQIGSVVGSNNGLVTGATVFNYIDSQNYTSGNENITLSGDISGSGTTSISTSIQSSAISGKTNISMNSTTQFLANNSSTIGKITGQDLINFLDSNLNTDNTTYTLSVVGSNIIRLAGSDSTNNDVSFSGTTNEITVTSNTSSDSFTIGLPNNVVIGNNLTVTGNLVVEGTTTSVNSNDLLVKDKLITLSSGSTGISTSYGSGIEIDINLGIGDPNNPRINWDSSGWSTKGTLPDFTVGGALKITTVSTSGSGNNALFIDGTDVFQKTLGDLAFLDSNEIDQYTFWKLSSDGSSINISSEEQLTISGSGSVSTSISGNTLTISGIDTKYTDGDGLNLNSEEFSVDNTVIRTTGNQTKSGILTFNNSIKLADGAESGILDYVATFQVTSPSASNILVLSNQSAVWIDYFVQSGTDVRTGTLMITKNSSNAGSFTDTSVDLGDTDTLEFSVGFPTGGDIEIKAQSSDSSTYNVKFLIRSI